MSFYRAQYIFIVPITTQFDTTRYKKKKPLPSPNTFVVVEGFLTRFDVDHNSTVPTVFHISVDNLSYIGKAPWLRSILPSVAFAHVFRSCASLSPGPIFRFDFGLPPLWTHRCWGAAGQGPMPKK